MSLTPHSDDQAPPSAPCRTAISTTDQFYEDHPEEYSRRTRSADMSKLYARFLPNLPMNGRILDAGCGSGRDLRAFSERGYRPVGIDASPALVESARAYSGVPCWVARIEEMTFEQAFDGVWACASLLHFVKIALPTALRHIHAALVPNGTMFASVQEGDGEQTAADGRFYAYYQRREFLNVIAKADFVIKDEWESDDLLRLDAPRRWINVLARAE